MFGKGDKKKRGAGGTLTVGALAAVGAISIFKKGKRFIKDTGKRIMNFFKDKSDREDE